MKHYTTSNKNFHEHLKIFLLESNIITKIGFPNLYNTSESWLIKLTNVSTTIDITSENIMTENWWESADLLLERNENLEKDIKWIEIYLQVNFVDLFYFEEDGERACCGVELRSQNGDFLRLSGGMMPGSLTILSNILNSKYNPEFNLDESFIKKIPLELPDIKDNFRIEHELTNINSPNKEDPQILTEKPQKYLGVLAHKHWQQKW